MQISRKQESRNVNIGGDPEKIAAFVGRNWYGGTQGKKDARNTSEPLPLSRHSTVMSITLK